MKTIEIDDYTYDKLGEIAIPFVETNPSMVIRRLLDFYDFSSQTVKVAQKTRERFPARDIYTDLQSSSDEIEKLRQATPSVHQAFLTFLMDKYTNSHGNYRTAEIVPFMETMNLQLPSGLLRNPWMKAPYGGQNNGVTSCNRTIEHFRQTRKYGCWNGKDIKENCDASGYCIYHPENPDEIGNKCDLRKEVIWKRAEPDAPFVYGKHYLNVIKRELLGGGFVTLEPLLSVFYPDKQYNQDLIDAFKDDFHMNGQEMEFFTA